MPKHRFRRQSNQRFPPLFDIILYRYCRLSMPYFRSSEHLLDKILKIKLDMKNSFENLLDFILRPNSTDQNGPSCSGTVLLTDIF